MLLVLDGPPSLIKFALLMGGTLISASVLLDVAMTLAVSDVEDEAVVMTAGGPVDGGFFSLTILPA
jgi:hypothetical protein